MKSTFQQSERAELKCEFAVRYFVVWLHGMHCGMIGPKDLRTMQWRPSFETFSIFKRLGRLLRRVIFMVPLSPRPLDGLSFNWGCAFTKQQNRKALEGFFHCFKA